MRNGRGGILPAFRPKRRKIISGSYFLPESKKQGKALRDPPAALENKTVRRPRRQKDIT